MNWISIVIIVLLSAAVIGALVSVRKHRDGCGGCSGCDCCEGCSVRRDKKTR